MAATAPTSAPSTSSTSTAGGGREMKRQRIEIVELNMFQSIAQSLHEVWTRLQEQHKSASTSAPTSGASSLCEIEVRVGMQILSDQNRRWRSQQPRNLDKAGIVIVDDNSLSAYSRTMGGAVRVSFKSGVDEVFVEHVRSVLAEKKFTASVLPASRIRYDSSSSRTVRWEVGPNGEVKGGIEEKNRFYRKDFALISHTYDIRIDAANELTSASASASATGTTSAVSHPHIPKDFTHERLKRRTTFRSKEFGHWKIDLTEVEVSEFLPASSSTSHGTHSSNREKVVLHVGKEVELELELEPASTKMLQEATQESIMQLIPRIALQLVKILNLCIPHEVEAPSEQPLEKYVTTSQPKQTAVLQEIRRLNSVLRSASAGSSTSSSAHPSHASDAFIGSLPINMTRRNLLNVLRTKYFLTEKSDGVRHLLYCISEGSGADTVALLMDRGKALFKINGCAAIGAALKPGMVLDGELVLHRTLQQTIFLIFDVLAIDGNPCVHLPFSQRNRLIDEVVMPRYLQAFPTSSAALGTTPLVRKRFVDKTRLPDLLAKIKVEDDGERAFKDVATSTPTTTTTTNTTAAAVPHTHHKTDGFIFQPDSPYVMACDSSLLKWKWDDLRSVDLVALETGETVQSGSGLGSGIRLFCDGDEGMLIDCSKRGSGSVALGTFDTLRLRADMQDFLAEHSISNAARGGASKDRRGRIAEVVYSTSLGVWAYKLLRKDKSDPNHIYTLLGVCMEQADGISIEELEYRLIGCAIPSTTSSQPSGVGGGAGAGAAEATSTHALDDDYQLQLQRLKGQLLTWRKESVAKKQGGGSGGASAGGAAK